MITAAKNVTVDLQNTMSNILSIVPKCRSRRDHGIAFGARRCLDILECEDTLDDAIDSVAEEVDYDHYEIDYYTSYGEYLRVEYFRGKLSVDADVLGTLKGIKERQDEKWMMTGIRTGKNHHRVKMWCVDAEDKRRIEAAGNKVVGLHETYTNIEFLPW